MIFIVSFLAILLTSRAEVINIVQRRGSNTTLTCPLPSPAWEYCVFYHQGGSQGDCSLSPDQPDQPCSSFQDSVLHTTTVEGVRVCQLVINKIKVRQQLKSASAEGRLL